MERITEKALKRLRLNTHIVWQINLSYPPPLRCQCEAVMGRAQGTRQGPAVPLSARRY